MRIGERWGAGKGKESSNCDTDRKELLPQEGQPGKGRAVQEMRQESKATSDGLSKGSKDEEVSKMDLAANMDHE